MKFHEILHKNDHHNHVFEEFSRDFHDLKTDYHDLNDQTINDHLTNILKNEISDFKKEKDLKKLFNKCL